MITQTPLDLDAVQAFALVADLGSFTRAAEALDTTQPAISLKIKRLEKRLGFPLLERTPRVVRLSARGEAFQASVRDLLAAHERVLAGVARAAPRRLILGISDHVAGPDLPALLARLNAYDPLLSIEVRIASSRDMLTAFDKGEIDAALVRREGDRKDGEVVTEDRFGWFAAPGWAPRAGEPLRIANMTAPCSVRALATRVLDAAGMPWIEVFVGGGVMAVGAAVSAGLAVAALSHRVAPPGAVEVGETFGLPVLPLSPVVLYTRVKDRRTREALKVLAAGLKGAR